MKPDDPHMEISDEKNRTLIPATDFANCNPPCAKKCISISNQKIFVAEEGRWCGRIIIGFSLCLLCEYPRAEGNG